MLRHVRRILTGMVLFAAFALVILMTTFAAESITDAQIKQAVEDELLQSQFVNANRIDVSVNEGVVTFEGTADSLMSKEKSVELAEKLKGVRAIVNMLDVRDAGVDDEELQDRVAMALLVDPATDLFEVDVSVEDGAVTLSGTVNSWAEKRLCADVAKHVTGVKEVKNEIKTKLSDKERPDSEIQAEILARLEHSVWIDPDLIKVEVQDGNVTLSGAVGSAAERRWAGLKAWVNGVKDVKTKDVEVKWWMREQMKRTERYTNKSDHDIKQAVEDALRYDPRTVSFNVHVSVRNATVNLSGKVDNLLARKAAERDARNTVGVWRVKNHLKIRPDKPFSDSAIKKQVNKAFMHDSTVRSPSITVLANDGNVVLAGNVNSLDVKQRAEEIAASIPGVYNVDNKITVANRWRWYPDFETLENVRDQLTSNAFLDESMIFVNVVDGTVILKGEVDTWNQKVLATQEAYQGGAEKVENYITVLHGHPILTPYEYGMTNPEPEELEPEM